MVWKQGRLSRSPPGCPDDHRRAGRGQKAFAEFERAFRPKHDGASSIWGILISDQE